jgi:hypothetical protein
MLELVHPALQKDTVILPPKSHECDDDIHMYYQNFDAWLRYETNVNCSYSPREQVNHFIRELSPMFAPAVDRIRQLLDSWNPGDHKVPDALKITSLPNTIERFMMEDACIRIMYEKKQTSHHKHGDKQNVMEKERGHELVDKYCYYCGQHCHMTVNCKFMAKLINATEHLNKVDTKVKKELQEQFRQKQWRRRAKQLAKQTNIIRKLLDTGGSREDIETALAQLNQYEDAEYANQQDASSNSDSTTDSK